MTVWDAYRSISRRLLVWSGLSAGAGVLSLIGGSFWRGFGIQAIAWGLVDALIALVGAAVARRRREGLANPLELACLVREERNLRRLLLVNTGLDVLYVAGGVTLALTLGAADPTWRGHGWSIVVQGAFLLGFDLFHAQQVPRSDQ
jgi:hypothetical protein